MEIKKRESKRAAVAVRAVDDAAPSLEIIQAAHGAAQKMAADEKALASKIERGTRKGVTRH